MEPSVKNDENELERNLQKTLSQNDKGEIRRQNKRRASSTYEPQPARVRLV